MTVSVTLNNLANLQNQTTAVNTVNNNNTAITTGFNSTLNTSGDKMNGNIDMNSNRVLNLGAPASLNEPARLQDIVNLTTSGSISLNPLPVGGAAGTILVKNSATNYDFVWGSTITNAVLSGNTTASGSLVITTSSINALEVLPTGGINPSFNVVNNAVSAVTGFQVTASTLGAGVALAATSSGTNENLSLDAKGTGVLQLGTQSGSIALGAQTTLTTVSTQGALVLNATGGTPNQAGINFQGGGINKWSLFKDTSHVLSINDLVNSVNFLTCTSGTISSGNISIPLTTASTTTTTGALTISGGLGVGGNINNNGAILSKSATGGVGYTTGSGGSVTQLTSRTTGVTLNTISGQITIFAAAGSASVNTFTVSNSTVAANDLVLVSVKSATNTYYTFVTAVAAGSFQITFYAGAGTASDSPVFTFAVIKGSVN